ncbi:MAG: mercuric reductase [Vicinamibacterales bacterium]
MIPNDEFNQALLAHVHPADWVSPAPQAKYDLVVVGAGTAGLVTAVGAAGLGARVAIIERHLMGGDCLNFGCVPSKAVIAAARTVHAARAAMAFGATDPGAIDFERVMARMRRLRAGLAAHDSAARLAGLGIDVFLGDAQFAGTDVVEVNGVTVRFAKAVIATGARSAVPPIPGLPSVRFLTNETVFDLTQRPEHLIVLGAGPIGCELAQTFRRLGARVSLVSLEPRVLPREDPDASAVVQAQLASEGIRLFLGGAITAVMQEGHDVRVIVEGAEPITGDALLVATGRTPNLQSLALDRAGVRVDSTGIVVDDHLRTSNRRIFAAGDVCSVYKFTHAADAMARIVIQNALFFGRKKVSDLVVPWATYTDPEVAHVGLTADQAHRRGASVVTLTVPLSSIDRAVLEGRTDGFARVHVEARAGRILGATIVGEGAGELIGEMAVAMASRVAIGAVGGMIHPYPTRSEAWKKLGDQWNKRRLTPFAARVLRALIRWQR